MRKGKSQKTAFCCSPRANRSQKTKNFDLRKWSTGPAKPTQPTKEKVKQSPPPRKATNPTRNPINQGGASCLTQPKKTCEKPIC